jgi:acyl-CoA synthetase (NDP forming)
MPGESAGPAARDDTLGGVQAVFAPRSIAVIGASADPSKRGHRVLTSLRTAGFEGAVYAVNPRGGSVDGIPLLSSVDDLPADVDLALVALPSTSVPDVVERLAERGVKAAVVLANGFRESGADGAALEERIASVLRRSTIRVVGPNTSGVINTMLGVNLVGVADVPPGPVSLIAQSGNMLLTAIEDVRASRGPGLHCYVGLGNQLDIGLAECLPLLAESPGTKAIAVHCEGFSDGRALLQTAAAVTSRCPIVMLRGGRSTAGQRAALSHTGSAASSDRVATAVLRQAGIELVDRADELMAVAGVLAAAPLPTAGLGVAVLSDGGGHATLAVDAFEAAGVPLAELAPETQTVLRQLLGASASVRNPVDVAGATDGDPYLFARCTDALMSDAGVGLVVIVGLLGAYHLRFDTALEAAEEAAAHELVRVMRFHGRPVVVHSCYSGRDIHNHATLRSGDIPVLPSLDHTVRAVAALVRRSDRLHTADRRSSLELPQPRPHHRGEPHLLSEPQARRILDAAGIATGRWQLVRRPDDLGAAVASLGGRCAVRVVSAEVAHKSDVGGVRLDVRSGDAEVWTDIVRAVRTHRPNARIEGMVVTPMAGGGVELLVGAYRDATFGPVVAVGLGGVLVDAIQDVAFRAAPLTETEAIEMINDTRAHTLIAGYRAFAKADLGDLVALVVGVADLIARDGTISEIDINPLIIDHNGLHLADVRVVVDRRPGDLGGGDPCRDTA